MKLNFSNLITKNESKTDTKAVESESDFEFTRMSALSGIGGVNRQMKGDLQEIQD